MNIRLTSSLTPEDENLVAPGVLRALTSILDLLPIAYVIRIDTAGSKMYEQSGGIGASAPVTEAVSGSDGAAPSGAQRVRTGAAPLGRLKHT